jgi:predicted nucleic-acid-binding protein
MIGLDTNTLVRYLLRDDDKQALRLAARLDDEIESGHTLLINDIVLVELIWVLKNRYGFDKQALSAVVEKFLDSPNFEFENRDVTLAALALFKSNKAGLSDCLIGAKNKRLGCETTLTFDRDAAKIGTFNVI